MCSGVQSGFANGGKNSDLHALTFTGATLPRGCARGRAIRARSRPRADRAAAGALLRRRCAAPCAVRFGEQSRVDGGHVLVVVPVHDQQGLGSQPPRRVEGAQRPQLAGPRLERGREARAAHSSDLAGVLREPAGLPGLVVEVCPCREGGHAHPRSSTAASHTTSEPPVLVPASQTFVIPVSSTRWSTADGGRRASRATRSRPRSARSRGTVKVIAAQPISWAMDP